MGEKDKKGFRTIIGIAVGSILTAAFLYLPFSGLLGMFWLPGLLGILFSFSLVVPGAILAGLIVHERTALAGAATGLLGYLILLVAVPMLRPSPFFPIQMVALNGLMYGGVSMAVGWFAGAVRRKYA